MGQGKSKSIEPKTASNLADIVIAKAPDLQKELSDLRKELGLAEDGSQLVDLSQYLVTFSVPASVLNEAMTGKNHWAEERYQLVVTGYDLPGDKDLKNDEKTLSWSCQTEYVDSWDADEMAEIIDDPDQSFGISIVPTVTAHNERRALEVAKKLHALRDQLFVNELSDAGPPAGIMIDGQLELSVAIALVTEDVMDAVDADEDDDVIRNAALAQVATGDADLTKVDMGKAHLLVSDVQTCDLYPDSDSGVKCAHHPDPTFVQKLREQKVDEMEFATGYREVITRVDDLDLEVLLISLEKQLQALVQ